MGGRGDCNLNVLVGSSWTLTQSQTAIAVAIARMSIALGFCKYRSQSWYRPKMAATRKCCWAVYARGGPVKGGVEGGGGRISSCQVAGNRAIRANRRHGIANCGEIAIGRSHLLMKESRCLKSSSRFRKAKAPLRGSRVGAPAASDSLTLPPPHLINMSFLFKNSHSISISASICLFLCLSPHLSLSLSLCPSVSLSLCLSAPLPLCLSVSLSLSLSLSLYLSLCLYLSISLSDLLMRHSAV